MFSHLSTKQERRDHPERRMVLDVVHKDGERVAIPLTPELAEDGGGKIGVQVQTQNLLFQTHIPGIPSQLQLARMDTYAGSATPISWPHKSDVRVSVENKRRAAGRQCAHRAHKGGVSGRSDWQVRRGVPAAAGCRDGGCAPFINQPSKPCAHQWVVSPLKFVL